ncbi:hypothetical protein K505DRAFT_374358 [Melanomma pulvis-pyrius CBS 109.77]|uniref:Uncharacterized protein n=1 Tax=Melanomma pulvis-pyrius CBS 109.77 TaxID=1314802 RepID=A0A6A6XGM4_9PLEO|nr:hypothetical protein K505DRAFT_374358 [Melanomma pulvis-pyrius CBS 109.77]
MLSSAFVCVRCELKLARPRLAALSRRPSRAAFSASARRHDALDEPPPFQFPVPRPRSELSERPLGRLRKRKGKAPIRETTARLGGVKALGDDAEILMLKEEGDAPPEETPTPHVDTREPVDIIASLQLENAEVGQDDIHRLLESLRPQTHAPPDEPQYISQATFFKLNNALIEGFTTSQLSYYYTSQQRHRKKNSSPPTSPKIAGTAKSTIDRTEWHPGTTQLTRRLPGAHLSRGIKKKAVSKVLLADQILRTIWNAVLLEEIEAPGEIELILKPWQLHLLNSSNPTPLDRIGRDRKAKIEFYQSHHVLRITADKSTAEYAADDVQQLLQNTETLRLNLEPWLPFMTEDAVAKNSTTKRLPPRTLEAVAKLSGTYIQVVTDHMVLIRGLSKHSVEEARRGLFQMLPFQTSPRYIDRRKLDAMQEQRHLLPTAFKNFLDYRFRSLELGRWALPILKSTDDGSTPQHEGDKSHQAGTKSDQHMPSQIVTALQATQDNVRIRRNEPKESFQVRRSVSAEFGQVLVPLINKTASDALNAPFCHVFPGLSKLLMNEAFSTEAESATPKLEYEFTGNPAQANPLKDGQKHPDLLMKFKYQQGSEPKLHSVTLKMKEHFHDVLLPEKAVDIRYKVTQELKLLDLEGQPQVREYIDAICVNIESGARLTAPPLLEIKVPKSAIPGSSPYAKGDRILEYFLTGIRYRQSVTSEYQKHVVSYSTTRAGKLGKKGGTLSVYYNVGKDTKLSDVTALKKFVQTSFVVADQLTAAAANNKPMAKTIRPRDQTSARKTRRSEARNSEYTPHNFVEFETDHVAPPAFDTVNSTIDRIPDDAIEHPFRIADGDIENPYIASFLSEDNFTEPEIAEKVDTEEIRDEPSSGTVNDIVEVGGTEIDEVVDSEGISNEPTLSEPKVTDREENKALQSSS